MILESIAVISAANAAISTIKEAIGNGKDLMAMGQELDQYFDAKAKLQQNASRSGSQSEISAFLALEQLAEDEQQLKTTLVWMGKAGTYERFLKYQAQQKQQRDDDKKQILKRKLARSQTIKNAFIYTTVGISLLGMVGGMIAALIYFISFKVK
tara:strand:- start:724 stop:1185 length:462 start_codon:yes stop_codon:yes gene_type:complete